ncbi:hypothetical protein BT93_E2831 [Corymbia citriodora subsp. variegata]|nr:hypothetical protein BT93_E2831 [Corymbia citriodora subsp. variegata]
MVSKTLTSDASPQFKAWFAGTLWSIWKQRNASIFRRQTLKPTKTINEADQEYLNFTKWNLKNSSNVGHTDPRTEIWKPPDLGVLKINLDAAWSCSDMEGSAAVYRNAQGLLTSGFAGKIRASSATLVETLTIRMALLWIRDKRSVFACTGTTTELLTLNSKLILASDGKSTVLHVLGLVEVPWAKWSTVEDCKHLMAQLENVLLIYEPRAMNRAADLVAKAHLAGSLPPNWVTCPPQPLISILCHEFQSVCNETSI